MKFVILITLSFGLAVAAPQGAKPDMAASNAPGHDAREALHLPPLSVQPMTLSNRQDSTKRNQVAAQSLALPTINGGGATPNSGAPSPVNSKNGDMVPVELTLPRLARTTV